jgi:hypothetical protein
VLPRSCLRLRLVCGFETVDRLLHERLVHLDASVDLFGKNFEALIAEAHGVVLPRLRKRWHHCEMIAGMERDGFGYHPHVPFKAVEPDVHVVETLLYDFFCRWGRLQKVFKGRFHEDALADARTITRSAEPVIEFLGKPDGHLAGPDRLTPCPRCCLRFAVPDLHFKFALELHWHSSPLPRSH